MHQWEGAVHVVGWQYREEGLGVQFEMMTVLIHTHLCLAGKSDPYCIMGIVPKKHQEMKKHNLHDLKDKVVGELQATSVKPETLTPEWNEQFEL